MLFDDSEDEEVCYETFRKYRLDKNSHYDPTEPPSRNIDKLSFVISTQESEITENHIVPLTEVLNSDHITEKIIEVFEQYTLSNMSDKELIKLIVLLIKRFQKCRPKQSQIHLTHLMTYLNDLRLMLVILSKKFIANEFIFVYRMPVWNYLKSYLKYLSGLIKVETSAAATIAQHETQLVHMFNMLGRLFQVKQIQDDLRMYFMNCLVHLFFSSTSGSVNQAIRQVICTAIYKYDWMDIYLYEIFKYDTEGQSVRTKFNVKIQKKNYNVHSTTMLLIQIIDHELELNLDKNVQALIRIIFTKSYEIINLALKYNQTVLVSVMQDLNKMCADLTEIRKPGIVLLYYYSILQMREMIIKDRVLPFEHGAVIDTYFEMMTQICINYKNVENKSKHLDLSRDVVYELMDKVDDTSDQFTLMSMMFSTTILSKQPLIEEDRAILNYSKLTFKDSKSSNTRKSKKKNLEDQRTKTKASHESQVRVLSNAKQSDVVLCFNYFINKRMNQTVLKYCLQSILTKLMNAQSTSSVTRYVKYLSNVQQFCSKSYKVLDEDAALNTMSVMYEITKSCEHKVVQQLAISIICNFCSKRDSYYNMFKASLACLLCRTENLNVFKILCDFFMCKIEELNEHLNLVEPADHPELDVKNIDIEFSVIRGLLVRIKNSNFKPIILNFFSKRWFEWETQSSKLDHKVEQMIKLVKLNWRDELKELIQELFEQTVDLKKSTLLSAKQIVYTVIKSNKDDNIAWEVVLYFSKIKSNFLVEYFGDIYKMIQEVVTQQNFDTLQVLAKVVSNIVVHNKANIDHDKLEEMKGFLLDKIMSRTCLNIKIICIELMRLFDWENDKIQKNFSSMYNQIQKRLERSGQNLAFSTSNEKDIYLATHFFRDVYTLTVWMNNWPNVISKCKEFKSAHLKLVQDICELYYRTQDNSEKNMALQSLGKIHSAFPDIIQSTKVVEVYGDILKNSQDDALKCTVVTNIHCHIKEMNKQMEILEAKEKSTLDVKSIDNELLDEASSIANRYLSPILDTYYTILNPTKRSAVVKFLMQNLKFGTLVAHQVVGHMIAMLQDNNFHTKEFVYQELEQWNKMDPTLLINHFRKGIVNGYKLEKLMFSTTSHQIHPLENNNTTVNNKSEIQNYQSFGPRGYKIEKDFASPRLQAVFNLILKKSELVLKMVVYYLEEEQKKMNDPGLFAYIVDNIALFPYTTSPQLRVVLHELEVFLSSEGSHVLKQYRKLDKENETKHYQTYLKMAHINLLIELKLFLWKKYEIPIDLIHNKRYETLKQKIKIRTPFDQKSALDIISHGVEKLLVKPTDFDKMKEELVALRRDIAKYIEDKDDKYSEESELCVKERNKDLTYDEYMEWQASQSTKDKNKDTANEKPVPETNNNKDKNRKLLDSKTHPHENETNTNKEAHFDGCSKTNEYIDENIETIPDNKEESEKKNFFKELFQSKRPIPPHIVEKAKQANIDWMIRESSNGEAEEKSECTRKSQVHFKMNEQLEDQPTVVARRPNKTKENGFKQIDTVNNEIQKAEENKTTQKSNNGGGKKYMKIEEEERNMRLDDTIDTVINHAYSLDSDMNIMKVFKKRVKNTSTQQKNQRVNKETRTRLDNTIDAVIKNKEPSDVISIKPVKKSKDTTKEKTFTHRINKIKHLHTSVNEAKNQITKNTTDTGNVKKVGIEKHSFPKLSFVKPLKMKSKPSPNRSGNEADEDSDFINENKKRRKRQDKKKVKKIAKKTTQENVEKGDVFQRDCVDNNNNETEKPSKQNEIEVKTGKPRAYTLETYTNLDLTIEKVIKNMESSDEDDALAMRINKIQVKKEKKTSKSQHKSRLN